MYYFVFVKDDEVLDFKPKNIHSDNVKLKIKPSDEKRVEPPIPMEPVIKSNIVIKEPEKLVKVDSGNTISKDAIKKEEEELDKRPEIEILEKLKSHENEEKKILAETKQILEELKGAQQMQLEKSKKKPVKPVKDLKSNVKNKEKKEIPAVVVPSNEVKSQFEEVVKDRLPFPLMVKEANKPNNSEAEPSREKRDLMSSVNYNSNNIDEKEENCNKQEEASNKDANVIKPQNNVGVVNVEN